METTRASLLMRIRNRADSVAWTQFDAIYRPLLARLARRCGLDESATDDIVQECLVAIHRHIDGFEYDPVKGRFKAWLRTMVRNRVRDHWRARRKCASDGAGLDLVRREEPMPDEEFERAWRQEHLRHCLEETRNEVEPATHDAFCDLVLHERPIEDICRARGMTPNQVYLIKLRMLGRLRGKLREFLDTAE